MKEWEGGGGVEGANVVAMSKVRAAGPIFFFSSRREK